MQNAQEARLWVKAGDSQACFADAEDGWRSLRLRRGVWWKHRDAESLVVVDAISDPQHGLVVDPAGDVISCFESAALQDRLASSLNEEQARCFRRS